MAKVQSQVLKNRIIAIYRDTSTYWNWSTADAIRYTKTTGLLVGDLNPNDHIEKGNQLLVWITKRFNADDLNQADKKIAEDIFNDITNALNGN
jgi:hypothetical protein